MSQVRRFGELACKIWSPRNFKGQVSPHEFMQAVLTASGKRFLVDSQGDPVEFLSWLLHELHKELGGTKKFGSSVIDRALQGELLVTTLKDTKQADGTVTTKETKDKCADWAWRRGRPRRGHAQRFSRCAMLACWPLNSRD